MMAGRTVRQRVRELKSQTSANGSEIICASLGCRIVHYGEGSLTMSEVGRQP